MPAINSRACGRAIIGCTTRPSMRASGRATLTASSISRAAVPTASALARLKRTPPTSDLCTISRDRILIATAWPAARNSAALSGLLRRRGNGQRDSRNAIGRQERVHFDRIEPCSALFDGAADDAPRRRGVRREIRCNSRWRFHQRITRLAIAHHVHEAAYCVVFGRKVRYRCFAEGPCHRSIGANPGRKYGLRRCTLLRSSVTTFATVAAISAADARPFAHS